MNVNELKKKYVFNLYIYIQIQIFTRKMYSSCHRLPACHVRSSDRAPRSEPVPKSRASGRNIPMAKGGNSLEDNIDPIPLTYYINIPSEPWMVPSICVFTCFYHLHPPWFLRGVQYEQGKGFVIVGWL